MPRYTMRPGYLDYPVNRYTVSHIYNNVCAYGYAGMHVVRTSGTNYDYTWGLSIYGVGYESQAGWSTNVKLGLQFIKNGGFCANNVNFNAATLWDGR